jgi:hypothetical protein
VVVPHELELTVVGLEDGSEVLLHVVPIFDLFLTDLCGRIDKFTQLEWVSGSPRVLQAKVRTRPELIGRLEVMNAALRQCHLG